MFGKLKVVAVVILISLIPAHAIGQNSHQNVVYLKNGSIITGTVIEQIPNSMLKVKTRTGDVLVYQMSDVDKITSEQSVNWNDFFNNNKKRGYIGISAGPSMPIGDFSNPLNGNAKAGPQLHLLNAAYYFTNTFGIGATWFGAVNELDIYNNEIDPWIYGGILVGPIISFKLSDLIDLDFRQFSGYSVSTVPDFGSIDKETVSSFAFSFGVDLISKPSNNLNLNVSLDYLSTEPEFEENRFYQHIETLSFRFGVAYRFNN